MSSRLDYPHATFNVALSKWPGRHCEKVLLGIFLAGGWQMAGSGWADCGWGEIKGVKMLRQMRWAKSQRTEPGQGLQSARRSREQQRKISFEMLM